MSAADADDALNGKVLYFLSHEAHGAFTVDENTGVITTSAALDREKWPSYNFRVFAVDLSPAAPRNASAQVTEGLEPLVWIHIPLLRCSRASLMTGDGLRPRRQRQRSRLRPGPAGHGGVQQTFPEGPGDHES